MKVRLCFVALLVCVGLLAACSGRADEVAQVKDSGSWQLVEATVGDDTVSEASTGRITLDLRAGGIRGEASCNTYRAGWRSSDDYVVAPISVTAAACLDAASNRAAGLYLEGLASVETAELDGNQLKLSGPDTVLRFDRTET